MLKCTYLILAVMATVTALKLQI